MTVKTGRLVKIILEDNSAIDLFFPHGELIVNMTTEEGTKLLLERTEAQELINAMRKDAKHTDVRYDVKLVNF